MRNEKTSWYRPICLIALLLASQAAWAWSTDGTRPQAYLTPPALNANVFGCDPWMPMLVSYSVGREEQAFCNVPEHPLMDEWPRSVAVGTPSRGALVYASQLYPNRFLTSRRHNRYGTKELVRAIERAVATVNARHEDTPVLHVGDLSRKNGGYFPPHLSHQSGQDVDIGYYMRRHHKADRFQRVTTRTLDVPRTWTLIQSFLDHNDVEFVFSDKKLIPLLRSYAGSLGTFDDQTLSRWFGGNGVIRHLKGHDDHLHIRLRTPDSSMAMVRLEREIGRSALRRLMTPIPIYTKIRSGDSIGRIAKRVGISQSKLRKFNRLRGRSPRIFAGKRLIVGYRYPSLDLPSQGQSTATKSTARSNTAKVRVSSGTLPNKASRQTAKLKTPRPSASKVSTAKGPSRQKSARNGRKSLRRHIVKAGENLSKLAHRYRVPTAKLCEVNRLAKNCDWSIIRKSPVHLRIGQKLKIPH